MSTMSAMMSSVMTTRTALRGRKVHQQHGISSSSTMQSDRRRVASFGGRTTHPCVRAASSAERSATIVKGRSVADKLNGTSVFLIGLMGTGKSTTGSALAKAMGYNHLDTDDIIKSVTKKTPAEIFAESGEEEFREIESMILAEVASYKNCVISTGGGIVCVKTNWMHLHNGVTVRLDAAVDVLASRIIADGASSRPALGDIDQGEGDAKARIVAKLESLLEARDKMYKQADIVVPVGARDSDVGAELDVVVDRVLDALDARVSEDAVQSKLRNEPQPGDVTVTDPRGEMGPKPKPQE